MKDGLDIHNTYGRVERRTQVLMVIPEGKWQLGRTWHKCEDNIKTDLQEVGQGSISGTGYRQMACSCECSNEPAGFTICREFPD